MKLTNTIKNIKKSTNSFFNLSYGIINLDLLKPNIKFCFEYGDNKTYIWKKEKLLKHPYMEFFYTQKIYNGWQVFICKNFLSNDVYVMKICKQ